MYDYFKNKHRYLQLEHEAIQGNKDNWTSEDKEFYNWMSTMEDQMSEFGCGKHEDYEVEG